MIRANQSRPSSPGGSLGKVAGVENGYSNLVDGAGAALGDLNVDGHDDRVAVGLERSGLGEVKLEDFAAGIEMSLLSWAKTKKVVNELEIGALQLGRLLTLAGCALPLLRLVAVNMGGVELLDELVNDALGLILDGVVLIPLGLGLEERLELGLGGGAAEVARATLAKVEGQLEDATGIALGDSEVDTDSGVDVVEEALELLGRNVELDRKAVLSGMVEVEAEGLDNNRNHWCSSNSQIPDKALEHVLKEVGGLYVVGLANVGIGVVHCHIPEAEFFLFVAEVTDLKVLGVILEGHGRQPLGLGRVNLGDRRGLAVALVARGGLDEGGVEAVKGLEVNRGR